MNISSYKLNAKSGDIVKYKNNLHVVVNMDILMGGNVKSIGIVKLEKSATTRFLWVKYFYDNEINQLEFIK